MKNEMFRMMTVCLGLALFPLEAQAAGFGTGKISGIQVTGTQFAVVQMESVSGSRPACHNAQLQFVFSIDLNTNKGRAMYSTINSAYLAGKELVITGSNACINVGAPFNSLESISILSTP